MEVTRTITVVALLVAAVPAGLAGGGTLADCGPQDQDARCSWADHARSDETATSSGSLHDAIQAHRWTQPSDVLALQAHQPLPDALADGLAQLVEAHDRSIGQASPQPLATRVPAVGNTLVEGAEELRADEKRLAVDALDVPQGSPVEAEQAGTLAASLADLYRAIGLGEDLVETLTPRIETASTELDEADRTALARLATAQARYQEAALATLQSLDAAAPATERALLEALAAQADLEATMATIADDWPQEETAGAEEPWSDPLGLVVLGTPGADRFDDGIDGNETVTEPTAAHERTARGTLAEASVEIDPLPEEPALTAQARAGTNADEAPRVGSGWHLLVLDPGGDDTYADNAAGIDAGTTITVDVATGGPIETAREPLVQDGHVCLPDAGTCEPFGAAGFLHALGTLATQVEARPGLAAPLAATVLDAGGHDTYTDTGPVIQGAARGPATGILLDLAGDDTYEATTLAQGAASLYGHGALVDEGGHDTYTADERAQAWARLPNLALAPTELGPLEGDDLTVLGVQHARALLLDEGGTDAYELEALRTGQGLTQLDADFAHHLRQRVPAELLDLGGEDQLPIPTRPGAVGSEPVEPTRVQLAGQDTLETWINRPLHAMDPSPPPDEDRRYKTALALDEAPPALVAAYGVEARDSAADCNAEHSRVLHVVCQQTDTTSTPGVLVGSPDRMEDPPALTIALTGHTVWEGAIATSHGSSSLHVDVLGDDRYEARDASIAYAEDGGTAVLVDVLGDDTVTAGNQTLAHARDAESTAIAWDVDGALTAETGAQSQGFARQLTSTPYARSASEEAKRPAAALLELGHGDDEGPAVLRAGNRSQGYSVGLGTAVLNGTLADDTYEVDGWGQGIHVDQQILQRFCDGAPIPAPTFLGDAFERTHPWLGGIGALLDPGGQDTYTVGSDVGQGDAATTAPACGPGAISNLFVGPTHASAPGLGLLHDEEGTDTYEQTHDPPRPPALPERACGGANDTPCRPADETAWTTVDEEPVNRFTGMGTHHVPAAVGLGLDGTDNADELPMAFCRGYEAFQPETLAWLVEELLPPVLEAPFMMDCDRTVRELPQHLPLADDAEELFSSLPTDDSDRLPFDLANLRGDAR